MFSCVTGAEEDEPVDYLPTGKSHAAPPAVMFGPRAEMFTCVEGRADEHPPCFEHVTADEMYRLEGRLEEWMQRVDERLETLILASRQPFQYRTDTAAGISGYRSQWSSNPPPSYFLTKREGTEETREGPLRVSDYSWQDCSDGCSPCTEEGEESNGKGTQISMFAANIMAHELTHASTAGTNDGSGPPAVSDRTLWDQRKEASRRLFSQAFWVKCDSVTHLEEEEARPKPLLEKLVINKYFNYGISLTLLINAVLIGVDVQWRASGNGEHLALEVLEWFCASIFAIELVLRLIYTSSAFCRYGQRMWACWDVILVGLSVVDLAIIVVPGETNASSLNHIGSTGRLLKIARMLRILRLLRMVRFLSELRVMTNMIQKSLKSLFWLFSLLALLIYIFSVVLTQGATEYLIQPEPGMHKTVVENRFGSLFVTMYTLFQAMCGGVSWGEVTTPLQDVGWIYFIVALLYIFFSIFSVFNIVTGVFVDGAIELAKQDRSMLTAKKALSREASAIALVELLKEMDTNCDNILTEDELKSSLLRTDVQEYLDALCVDTTQAEMLFALLDEDGNGEVDIEEFVSGMQRLQGEAKNFDVHMLIHANKQVLVRAANLIDTVFVTNPTLLAEGLLGTHAHGRAPENLLGLAQGCRQSVLT